MTALAFHPIEEYLCTGDITGRIVLWYGYQLQVGAIGELNLDLGDGNDAGFSPGIVSITPPADHVGRPFCGRERLVDTLIR